MLSHRLRASLASYGRRIAVEDAGGLWRLDGDQLLSAAAGLRERLGPEESRTVIVYMQKGPAYYALLACAFLYRLDFCPLDIENPIQRVLDVARQFGAPIILCEDPDVERTLREQGVRCIRLEMPVAAAQSEPRDGEGRYYIATSGSTGMPKLVQAPHERTMPFLDWAIPFYRIDPSTRWGQFSSIGFDLSLVDFLCTLCGGGTLVAIGAPMDRIMPARTAARAGLTHWHSVPSMIPYFLRDPEAGAASSLRVFSFCGEPFLRVHAEGLAQLYPGARILNTYGPTEATLFCSCFELSADKDADATAPSLPIGQPIPGWNFVLLPEPDGRRLVILSDHLSEGYVGLSSPQFTVAHLFGTEMPAFDTGDVLRTDGSHLYFSHRKDRMVKVNGNRIDLGEVEAAGTRAGLVNPVAAVVAGRIVLSSEGVGEADEIRAALGRVLPRSSVPAQIRFMPTHPRTVSGKLDRRAIADAFGP